jgi:asparagine synthase (glutamine-hydrolysing)
MSALFGKLNFSEKLIEQKELVSMLESLNYWKADKTKIWHEKNVGLGNLLLFNTPESLQERLPFYHAESRVAITADARIDNRAELFSQLGIDSTRQSGMPDSQLILQAYLKWGEFCPKYLYGAFAFAIWDNRSQRLFCARDQIGVKSLFYHQGKSFFAFATELKGLLATPEIPQEVSETYLDRLVLIF